jgi:hypothetical protein
MPVMEVGTKVLKTSGAVIDVLVRPSDGKKFIRLNTDASMPMNMTKTRTELAITEVDFDKEMAKSEKVAAKA